MSCGRATEIDVEAFLIDSGAPEFGLFRNHYPDCNECAAAVARWSAFDLALRDLAEPQTGNAHPAPERLEAYLTSSKSMGEEAMQIENHLQLCNHCETELTLLREFNPGLFLAGPGSITVDAETIRLQSPFSAIRDFMRSLSGDSVVGWQSALPALGILVLTVLGAFWWSGLFGDAATVSPTSNNPRLVDQTRPIPAAPLAPIAPRTPLHDPSKFAGSALGVDGETDDSRRSDSSRLPQEQIAIVPNEAPSDSETRLDDSRQPAVEPPLTQLAQLDESPAVDASRVEGPEFGGDNDDARARSDGSEEILLAALTALPPPIYSAPAGAESLGWMRQFGAVRSGPISVSVETRAPEGYAGLTLSDSPRLWWVISKDTDIPIQITLVNEEAIEPLLRVDFRGPHRAGLHSIDLGQHSVELLADVNYRWFVSLLVDPDRPSRNPVSAGALRVIPQADARRLAAAQSSASERGHTLARLGLWYDAYDFFAALSVAHPEAKPLVQYRERLVRLAKSHN